MSNPPILDPTAVAETIRARKTLKVLGNFDQPVQIDAATAERNLALVTESLHTAGWAPFHFYRGVDDIAEPWRAYLLSHAQCQALATKLPEWFDKSGPDSKIVQMLCACGALVLVTWLPETIEAEQRLPKHDILDHEHLAATAAMTQNLLLMLTAHGMGSYWSSGGVLRNQALLERLNIPGNQQLLAAVFIEYPETQSEARPRKPGSNRERRSAHWIQCPTIGT